MRQIDLGMVKDTAVSEMLRINSMTCGADFLVRSVYKLHTVLTHTPTKATANIALVIEALTLEVVRGSIAVNSMSCAAMKTKHVMAERDGKKVKTVQLGTVGLLGWRLDIWQTFLQMFSFSDCIKIPLGTLESFNSLFPSDRELSRLAAEGTPYAPDGTWKENILSALDGVGAEIFPDLLKGLLSDKICQAFTQIGSFTPTMVHMLEQPPLASIRQRFEVAAAQDKVTKGNIVDLSTSELKQMVLVQQNAPGKDESDGDGAGAAEAKVADDEKRDPHLAEKKSAMLRRADCVSGQIVKGNASKSEVSVAAGKLRPPQSKQKFELKKKTCVRTFGCSSWGESKSKPWEGRH